MKSKLLLIVCGGILSGAVHGADLEYPPESAFKRVVLAENPTKDPNGIVDPMELSVAKDGRVFFAERRGFVKYLDPKSGEVKTVGKVDVFTGLEDGLLGMTLDPNFEDNGWIYLFHSFSIRPPIRKRTMFPDSPSRMTSWIYPVRRP